MGLGDLPGGAFESRAVSVSGDGSIIVGEGNTSTPPFLSHAFIWDSTHGMRNLQVVLADDLGLDLGAWSSLRVEAISADGRTIVGTGLNPQNVGEAWMAVLPPPAPVPVPVPVPVPALRTLSLSILVLIVAGVAFSILHWSRRIGKYGKLSW